jgi:hypothetical protein
MDDVLARSGDTDMEGTTLETIDVLGEIALPSTTGPCKTGKVKRRLL